MNEQELIAQKQAEWDALAAQKRKAERLSAQADQAMGEAANAAEREYFMEMAGIADDRIDEIEEAMLELEDWLVDHCAPGWVSG